MRGPRRTLAVQGLEFPGKARAKGLPGLLRFPIVDRDEALRPRAVAVQLRPQVARCPPEELDPVARRAVRPLERVRLLRSDDEFPDVNVRSGHGHSPSCYPESRCYLSYSF